MKVVSVEKWMLEFAIGAAAGAIIPVFGVLYYSWTSSSDPTKMIVCLEVSAYLLTVFLVLVLAVGTVDHFVNVKKKS